MRTEQRGVPLLSRIPLLGGLFRWTRDTQEKTNLMVFLRPTILRTQAELIESGHRAYDGVRASDPARVPHDPRRLFEARPMPESREP